MAGERKQEEILFYVLVKGENSRRQACPQVLCAYRYDDYLPIRHAMSTHVWGNTFGDVKKELIKKYFGGLPGNAGTKIHRLENGVYVLTLPHNISIGYFHGTQSHYRVYQRVPRGWHQINIHLDETNLFSTILFGDRDGRQQCVKEREKLEEIWKNTYQKK